MSLTVAVINNKITAKFDCILDILSKIKAELDKCQQYDTVIHEAKVLFSRYQKEITQLKRQYFLSVVSVLNKYYMAQENKEEINTDYYNIIDSNNIIHTIDILISKVKKEYTKVKQKLTVKRDISIKFHELSYSEIKFNNEDNTKMNNLCECGGKIEFNANTNEMKCAYCSLVLTMDTFHYTNIDNKPEKDKKNNYKHERYFKIWIDTVQGLKKKVIPESAICTVRVYVETNRMSINNVYEIRGVLKVTNLSKYNMQAPVIFRLIDTNNYLPAFTEEQIQIFFYWFSIIRKYWKQMYKKNMSQYPYFLFKFEELLYLQAKEEGDLTTANNLFINMKFTYLQSQKTTIKNDIQYEAICERIGQDEHDKKIEDTGIKYITTDVDKYL